MNKNLKQEIDLEKILINKKSVAIGGHVNPDGDCIGACTGLFSYMLKYHPEIKTDLYLEDHLSVFDEYLPDLKKSRSVYNGETYDLVIVLDASTVDRIGIISELFENTPETVCIDHHASNSGMCSICRIVPEASSASEVLFDILDKDKIDAGIAACLYTGIVHDTGVFQYTCTSPATLRAAAFLVDKGIDFTGIIEDSFYKRSYLQARIMGMVLEGSRLFFNGKCIVGTLDRETIEKYGVLKKDVSGIVAQLRLTEGTELAVFACEYDSDDTKLSFRSNGDVDVNAIASRLGGGGHVKASGATLELPIEKAVDAALKIIGEVLGYD